MIMKELVTVFAACAIAGAVVAADSNVVGYNTLPPDGPWSMLGISFTECAGGALKLDKLEGAFTSGDQIQVPFTMSDGFTPDFVTYQYLTEADDLVDADGWYDGGWSYIGDTVELSQGEGVWYYSASGIKGVTVAGEVSKNVFSKTFVEPFTMTSSGFPVKFNPNAANFTWSMSSGDQIQIPFTMSDGFTPDFITYQYLTESEDLVDVDGWYDGGWALVDNVIADVGQGFWVYSQNGGSVTSTSPIAE